jgi:NADPH-ferrihemoprotein reductase
MIRVLASYCNNAREQAKLRELADADDDDFLKRTKDQFLLVCDILESNLSINLPLKAFVEIMPKLKVRFYSISSSALVYPTTAHISGKIVHFDILNVSSWTH